MISTDEQYGALRGTHERTPDRTQAPLMTCLKKVSLGRARRAIRYSPSLLALHVGRAGSRETACARTNGGSDGVTEAARSCLAAPLLAFAIVPAAP